MLNPDFKDMLSAFAEEKVEFLVVGSYALAAHGIPRATGDIDLWIRRSPENVARVIRAIASFGAPVDQLNPADLLLPDVIFQIGVQPNRVDILTSIAGVEFDEAWSERLTTMVAGVETPLLGLAHLIHNKRTRGLTQDLADLEALEQLGNRAANEGHEHK